MPASITAIKRLKLSYLAGFVVLTLFAVAAYWSGQAAIDVQRLTLERLEHRQGDAAVRAAADGEKLRAQADALDLMQTGLLIATLAVIAIGGGVVVPLGLRQVRETLRRLEESEERWRTVYAGISDAIVILSPDGRILGQNPAAARTFGYADEELAGRSLQALLPEPHRSDFPRLLQRLLTPGTPRMDLLLLHRGGGVIDTEVDVSAIQQDGRQRHLLVIHDVSRRKAQEEQANEALFMNLLKDLTEKERTAREMSRRATTDPLTGLYNRAKLEERLVEETIRAERQRTPLCLVILDIDHFKRINDTFGHATGDQVLSEIATVAKNSLRGGDLFARWGGEEFVIMAPDTDGAGGRRLGEKIRAAIERHPFDGVGRVTASFGLAERRPGEQPKALFQRADAALYRAKGEGRNRVAVAGNELTRQAVPGPR